MACWAASLSRSSAALLLAPVLLAQLLSPSAAASPLERPRQPSSVPARNDADAREQEALGLRDEAFELFKQQRYAEALPLLERAQALSQAPRHLFNLATAHHWLGNCASARHYFERYLSEAPAGAGAAEARAALDELYQHCGREPLFPAPAELPGASPAVPTLARGPRVVVPLAHPRAPPRDHALSWSLIGVGVALGAASAASLVLMKRTEADVEERVRRAPVDGWPREARALLENGDRYATLAAAFGVTAVACVGAGVTLELLAPGPSESLSLSLGGVQYRARF
jgi:tetratricopeptide (TPR) repeat protein